MPLLCTGCGGARDTTCTAGATGPWAAETAGAGCAGSGGGAVLTKLRTPASMSAIKALLIDKVGWEVGREGLVGSARGARARRVIWSV